jgi:hypothetical protein
LAQDAKAHLGLTLFGLLIYGLEEAPDVLHFPDIFPEGVIPQIRPHEVRPCNQVHGQICLWTGAFCSRGKKAIAYSLFYFRCS